MKTQQRTISRHWLSAVFFLLASQFLQAGNLPPGFAEVLVAANLDPTAMALAPDGRLFLTEKNGRVLLIENGQLKPDAFLQIEVDNYNERGLSGIALDPDFEQNGYVYLYFTVPNENHNRLSRFTADGDFAVPGSELILLELDHLSGANHNAGAMIFGQDGKLYISVGDGSRGDTSQDFQSLLGKILRINADGSIPADNPFFNETIGKYRSIYALGFRNSFSFTVQPGTGRLFACDVGSSNFEEVNEIFAGKNYGWPIVEGFLTNQNPPDNYQNPLHTYDHQQGCSVIGAAFYNPQTQLFPAEYAGKFFFADYCQGFIKVLNPDNGAVESTFATGINRPLNMLVAPDGTMYYLARAGIGGGSEYDNTASTSGTLWRVFYTGNGKPFVSVNPVSVLVSQGEDASFFTAASGVEPILYQWQREGADIPGATAPDFVFENTMLSDSGSLFRCIVTNGEGSDTTLEATLKVTSNLRPEPQIDAPALGATYRAGDLLSFAGMALDAEQGSLPASALRWKIDFHHNVHSHPALTPTTGIVVGDFTIPQTGEVSDDVWYRIYLTATDAGGLSKTMTRDVFPLKTEFEIHTQPEGFFIYVDGNFQYAPATMTSVVGIFRTITAPLSQVDGDTIWVFKKWLDGETDNERTFAAPDNTLNFTAIYEPFALGNGKGLRGFYYAGSQGDPTFYEPIEFSRIDSVVNFNWGDGSPATSLGVDFWLVRWEGFVRPIFDDLHHFYVIADDGIRLWVNNELVIDRWVQQPPTEATGSIQLSGGTQYPIRLEFFEEGGGAVCQLLWSSGRLAKDIIPQSQLYPELGASTVSLPGLEMKIYPNPFDETLRVDAKGLSQKTVRLELYNALGQRVHGQEETAAKGISNWEIAAGNLAAGVYWLAISSEKGKSVVVKVVKK